MTSSFYKHLNQEIETLKNNGLFKVERTITSPQEAEISLDTGKKVLNFCANNYLGLADHPEVIKAAKESLVDWGFGLASVRFICGTQAIHKKLEEKLSSFLGTEDTILYSSCFDANGGLFEPFFTEEDAIISDALNHASIIDGIRLCKAKRFRYNNNDMQDLEEKLKEASSCRFKIIATDGVFSMDGIIANLKGICDLAEKYGALVMVDDCHAVGFMGKNGKGTHEYRDVLGRIDFITGTLGKALGGASGGYVSGKKEAIEWLRQKSRPYLFSNTLCPSIATASLKAIEIVETDHALRQRLQDNSKLFREEMTKLGFNLVPGDHPIIPVMLGDAKLAQTFAKRMLEEGIYVVGFFYPVVPMNKARIRTQMSAAHTKEQILTAVKAFEKVGRELNVIS
jgi:glycine C-acetyltransferase